MGLGQPGASIGLNLNIPQVEVEQEHNVENGGVR